MFTLFGNTVGLVIIFKMNPFTVQGKAIPNSVRENIIESWLRGKGPTQIGKELRLQKKSLPTSLTTSFVEGIQKPKKKDAVNVYTVKSLLSRHPLEVQKKYSVKGKLNEKKIMHANQP